MSNRVKPGAKAGSLSKSYADKCYITIRLNKKHYLAHRLAWLLGHDFDPGDLQVDHINGDSMDNRLKNLRLATHSQNQFNQGANVKNATGFKGVTYNKARNKYQANIKINRQRFYLGAFDTPELAHMAYCKAAAELHGEFARGQ